MLEMIQMVSVVILCALGVAYLFACFSSDGEET